MKHLLQTVLLFAFLFFVPDSRSESFNVGGLSSGHPPYVLTSDASGRKGIYIDILRAITKITNDDFVVRSYPNTRLIKEFESGNIHIEPGVSPLWRTQWHNISQYSDSFLDYQDIVVFRKNESFPVASRDDLIGKNVATVKSYYYPNFDDGFKTNAIKRYGLIHELQLLKFLSVKQRGADLGFINKNVLQYYMAKYNFNFESGDTIGNTPVMFRFHKDKAHAIPRFNKALNTLRNNGTIDAIINSYF